MGGKLADRLSDVVGSWSYIIVQTAIFAFWVGINVCAPKNAQKDPYPFSFLNLMVGFMSAYTGPVLLMAANRQSDKDREKILESLALDKRIEKLTAHMDSHIHEISISLDQLKRSQGQSANWPRDPGSQPDGEYNKGEAATDPCKTLS